VVAGVVEVITDLGNGGGVGSYRGGSGGCGGYFSGGSGGGIGSYRGGSGVWEDITEVVAVVV
jgi:hypothetical protein